MYLQSYRKLKGWMSKYTSKFSYRLHTLAKVFEAKSAPQYQFAATINAIYAKNVKRYSDLSFLPASLREDIRNAFDGNDYTLFSLKLSSDSLSSQCTKSLFELNDGQSIEAVWMKFRDSQHHSVCISSQVGCALKCNFCATGAVGFKRQLSTDEIVDQVLYYRQNNHPVDTISAMGMGESLQNPRLFDALDILTDKHLCGFSPTRISVSTVGIIPGIERLTLEYPKVNLAFSLHSPFNDQRNVLVPANRFYPLVDILHVLKRHAEVTRKKIFVAYLVLPGVNDSLDHAHGIMDIFGKFPENIRHLFHLNLLRYNPAEGIAEDYKRTGENHIRRFAAHFNGSKTHVTIRQSFGVDIDAACGQLYQVARKKKSMDVVL
eukprot:Partr_v1_DN29021_c0_g1_i2_m58798 putative Radical SAM